jgi:hypothetical protein
VRVQDLAHLRVLDLSFNEIQALEAKVFFYLVNLVKLDLRANKISQISPDLFQQEGDPLAYGLQHSTKPPKYFNGAGDFTPSRPENFQSIIEILPVGAFLRDKCDRQKTPKGYFIAEQTG